MSEKSLWAVICGNIRDELDFKLTLTRLIELRSIGKIQHIVVSTWKGEIEKYPELRKQLESLQIYVLECYPLSDTVEKTPTGSVNYWRQARQLLLALDFIPKHDFVLRVRTDRSLNYINQMEKLGVFENYKIKVKELGLFPKIFEYKVTVFAPKMVRLLHMIDFAILGQNKDLYKFINFDIHELYFQKEMVANVQWYAQPFLKVFPILRDYMRFTQFVHTVKVLKDYVEKYKEDSVFPEVYYKVYAIYLLILYTHFNIVYTGNLNKKNIDKIGFYHFFSSSQNRGLQHTTLGTSIRDQEILHMAISGELTKSKAYERFLYYVNKIIAYGENDETFELSYPDYKQLVDLVNTKFYEQSDDLKWFKGLRKPPVNKKNLFKYNENIDVSMLDCITCKASDWYNLSHTQLVEKDLYDLWLKLENPTAITTEKMLFPIARTGNEYAIYILLDLFDKNLISDINIKELLRVTFFYLDIHVRRKTQTNQTTFIILKLLLMYERAMVDIEPDKIIPCGFEKFLNVTEVNEILSGNKSSYINIVKSIFKRVVNDNTPEINLMLASIENQSVSQVVLDNLKLNKKINEIVIAEKKWLAYLNLENRL
ncbi:hypothetical protein GCM10023206_18890 [Acinetobacter puyangensis]|uniref:Uncharacterized protein n=1 Tax=Acinetobacter puyangensis TaxID=1096779 RepID=A0A240E6L5_9GAMM|nr:hypothetical protein [Acinetobacter puyangensis]SNX43849.1 hypothetical protein SAMN05421731_1025 [Acinetobacter puyangensis]